MYCNNTQQRQKGETYVSPNKKQWPSDLLLSNAYLANWERETDRQTETDWETGTELMDAEVCK